MNTWKQYKRKGVSEMRPYIEGEDVSKISITETDRQNGSPMLGDMIARNPKDHTDQWLVAKKYFEENLEEVVLQPVIASHFSVENFPKGWECGGSPYNKHDDDD